MFTGIIQDIGVVKSVEKAGDWRFVMQTGLDLSCTEIGASIACAGCCLTVVEKGVDWFAVDVSQESLAKTTLKVWEAGMRFNIEPALKMGDELGGHIVSGHVDGLARVVGVRPEGDSYRLEFEAPEAFAVFIAQKGGIAINGVSLTVNEVEGARFGVNIIPHTWAVTTLSDLKGGDQVNFEVDMLARYAVRYLEVKNG
jgi:riboflavin synthase